MLTACLTHFRMCVADDELDAPKASLLQAVQELRPVRLVLSVRYVDAQNLAVAVGVDADRDEHRYVHDPVIEPGLLVARVQDQVRVTILEGARVPRLELGVQARRVAAHRLVAHILALALPLGQIQGRTPRLASTPPSPETCDDGSRYLLSVQGCFELTSNRRGRGPFLQPGPPSPSGRYYRKDVTQGES